MGRALGKSLAVFNCDEGGDWEMGKVRICHHQ